MTARPLSLARLGRGPSLGAGGSVQVLYARYNGGVELHDGSGHLPRDGSDYYISRTTGDRLAVDEGWSAGDTIGEPKLYGLLTAVVVGAPASARRSGLDQCTIADFVAVTIDNPGMTAVAQTTMTANGNTDVAFIGADSGTDSRFALIVLSKDDVEGRIYDASVTKVVRASSVDAFAAGATSISSASITAAGEMDIRLYDDAGTYLDNQASLPTTLTNNDGVYYIGRGRGSGEFANGCIDIMIGFDGTALTSTTADDLAADIGSGMSVDTIRDTYGPQLATDGIVCGAYDPASPSTLFVLSGSGAAVTASP